MKCNWKLKDSPFYYSRLYPDGLNGSTANKHITIVCVPPQCASCYARSLSRDLMNRILINHGNCNCLRKESTMSGTKCRYLLDAVGAAGK